MDIDELRKRKLIILECVSGSKAYGLNTPASDTDIKGVFILPKKEYYGLDRISQVSNATNDVVFYELQRFVELLSVNNPNILELVDTPQSCILYKHPFLHDIKTELIVSKMCMNTFGRFAFSQIKKARGLKKKIINPHGKERKSILSFCFVNARQGSLSLEEYLNKMGWRQEFCGLVKIPHMKDIFGLYYREDLNFNGIIKNKDSNEVCLSSIPKSQQQEAILYFNRDGYSAYCKEYHDYWDWVDKRNEERYRNTQQHGKNYDAKNMMHVFRLLQMACEIARDRTINVRRPNREFLLEIKSGKYDYEALLAMAEELRVEMEEAFSTSLLPDAPDMDYINELCYSLREKFYNQGGYG